MSMERGEGTRVNGRQRNPRQRTAKEPASTDGKGARVNGRRTSPRAHVDGEGEDKPVSMETGER